MVVAMKRKTILFAFGLLAILTSSLLGQAPRISLELEQGDVALNDSFEIKVILEHMPDRNTGQPVVAGLDQMHIIGTSKATNMEIVNNRVSTNHTYIFTVQPNKIGQFTLGPARIKANGNTIESNTVTVNVTREQTDKAKQANGEDGSSVIIKLETDNKNIVVGQPIILSMKIYVHGQLLQHAVHQPSYAGFLVKEIKTPVIKHELVDGVSYNLNEFKFILTPLQPGAKKIEPASVDYVAPGKRKRRRAGMFDDVFSDFFNPSVEQKRAISNELTLNVSPLPEHQGQVDGVGSFTSFQATLNKTDATINEPITLTLSIEGKGNFEQIAVPKLSLPNSFKYYDSKAEVEENLATDYLGGKKRFEFVLQASQAGTWDIPPQTFTFYDTNARSFQTFKTKPLSVVIKPGEGQETQPTQPIEPKEKEEVEEQEKPIKSAKEIHFIQEDAPVQQTNPFAFPLWLLIIILLIPPLFYFKDSVRKLITFIQRKFGSSRNRHFTKEEKELEELIKNGNPSSLYQFFLKFISSKWHISMQQVTEDWIEAQLHHARWEKEKIAEFMDYLNKCACFYFSPKNVSTIDRNDVIKRAKYWFLMLNK